MIEYGDTAEDSVWPGGLNLCQAGPVPGKALGLGQEASGVMEGPGFMFFALRTMSLSEKD